MNKIEDIKSNNAELDFNKQSKSQLSLKSFYYSWTLSDISKCLGFYSATVYSPEFDFEDTSWRLNLNILSNDNDLNEIKVRLCKNEKCGTGYYLKYKISLFDDNGSFATQEAQTKFGEDSIFGHWLTFHCEDHVDILDSAVESDEIVIHCEILVLSTITRKDSANSNITTKTKDDSIEKVKKQKKSHFIPSKLCSKRIFKRLPETRSEKRDTQHFFLLLFLCVIVMLMPTLPNPSSHNQTKEINDLVVSTTLKMINIADALNLTEVKNKSVDFLRSYYKDYNISDLEVSKVNSSDVLSSGSEVSELKVPKGQESTKHYWVPPPI